MNKLQLKNKFLGCSLLIINIINEIIVSKKIVLKSVFAVAVLGFILVFSSCKKDEKIIIGLWKYEKMEISELSCIDPFMEMMIRIGFQSSVSVSDFGTVEFTKEGKAITQSTYGNDIGTYKLKGNELIMTTSDGVSGASKYTLPDKKTLVLETNASEIKEVKELIQEAGIIKFVLKMTLAKQ